MRSNLSPSRARMFAAFGMALLLASPARAAAESSTAGSAVERGAHATANGVEHGAKAAVNGVHRGTNAAVGGVGRGLNAAARGIDRGAKATAGVGHRISRKVGGPPASTAPGTQ